MSSDGARRAKEQYGLDISLEWDDEALQTIAQAPKFVRKMQRAMWKLLKRARGDGSLFNKLFGNRS